MVKSNLNQNKISSASQKAKILEYLKKGGKLTGLQALQKFGCIKTSNRISELRAEGWNIKTTIIDTPTNKRVAEYSL